MANYTQHYQLHQWEATDNFLRTDFNTDLQKIDTALGEKENARIASGTYVGAGSKTVDLDLIFPFIPKLIMVIGDGRYALFLREHDRAYSIGEDSWDSMILTWTDYGLTWEAYNPSFASERDMLNESGSTYRYTALG